MRGIQALPGNSIHTLVPGDAPKAAHLLKYTVLLPITTESTAKDLHIVFKEATEVNYAM